MTKAKIDLIKTFTDAGFKTDVLKATLPVLVDFWAPWCGPCKLMTPVLEALAKSYVGKLTVGKIDIDAEPKTADKFRVQSIPMLMLFKGGKVVWSFVGAAPKKTIEAELKKHL